ncbi:Protein of unknown function [Gryllus bimaculatus]|nr:Protein of unknown function [Gryllus bimaculatus]
MRCGAFSRLRIVPTRTVSRFRGIRESQFVERLVDLFASDLHLAKSCRGLKHASTLTTKYRECECSGGF